MRLGTLGGVLLAMAALTVAARAEDPRDAAAKAMKAYPRKAAKAGQQGDVMLKCATNAHLALKDCVVVEERPPGFGLGQAALKLAAHSPDNPKVTVEPRAGGQLASFLFCLRPPSITPNPLLPRHTTGPASFLRQPTADQIARAYPPAAKEKGVSGRAGVFCSVSAAGTLEDCHAMWEHPTGQGFGAAAISLAPAFQANPETFDGEPRAGGRIWSEIAFGPAPPMPTIPVIAPLEWRCRNAASGAR